MALLNRSSVQNWDSSTLGVLCNNIVACQAHPALVKIGPVLVPCLVAARRSGGLMETLHATICYSIAMHP